MIVKLVFFEKKSDQLFVGNSVSMVHPLFQNVVASFIGQPVFRIVRNLSRGIEDPLFFVSSLLDEVDCFPGQ